MFIALDQWYTDDAQVRLKLSLHGLACHRDVQPPICQDGLDAYHLSA